MEREPYPFTEMTTRNADAPDGAGAPTFPASPWSAGPDGALPAQPMTPDAASQQHLQQGTDHLTTRAQAPNPRFWPLPRGWRPSAEWRRAWLFALLLWGATRIGLIVATYFAVLLPSFQATAAPGQLVDAWRHWDANWYVQIAQYGYNVPQTTAFFPLYPILIAATHLIVPGFSYFACALIVSNGALLIALALFFRLTEREFSTPVARTALLLLLAYPAAYYLSTGYTEALFLMWVVATFLAVRSGRWLAAGLLAAAATLTRPTGGMLVFPLIWEYLRQSPVAWAAVREHGFSLTRWRAEARHVRILLFRLGAIAAVPLAVALYAAYLWRRFGNPLLFKQVEGVYWYHHTALPTSGLAEGVIPLFHQAFTTFTTARGLLDVVPILVFLVIVLAGIKQVPLAYTAYALPVVLLSLIAPIPGPWPLQSGFRYVLAAFPVFMLVAAWCKRWPSLEMALIYVLLPIQGVLVYLFLHNAWLI